MINTDILVIGSGIAGLCAALEAARAGAGVVVASKGQSCASAEVMGFNAPVHPDDDGGQFFEDIVKSGEGINRTELARILAAESVKRIGYMEELGLTFDKNSDGTYNGMQALGNAYPRIVHHKGITGAVSLKLLRQACLEKGVRFLSDVRITDLLSEDNRVYGACGLKLGTDEFTAIAAGAVVLASGGCGAVHPVSTYPPALIGDGYAMAYRAGAKLVDMEFMQFEPCCFVYPKELEGRIIVTTMLNEGGKLLNSRGEEFLLHDEPGYRLQKGELARAIVREIAAGRGTAHGGIFFDVTALPKERVLVDCSLFSAPAMAAGIDMTKEACEVAPAAHTFLGGTVVNGDCETTVRGLYAAGEVIGGLHGANRLGGNAGAEIYTFGSIAGGNAALRFAGGDMEKTRIKAAELAGEYEARCKCYGRQTSESSLDGRELIGKAQTEIGNALGIFRSGEEMERGLEHIAILEKEAGRVKRYGDCRTLENMLLLARLQLTASLERKESRGVFFRTDYPLKDDEKWKKNLVLWKGEGGCLTEAVEVS